MGGGDLSINGQNVGFREVRKFTLDLNQEEQDALEAKVQQIAAAQGITSPEELVALRGQAFIQELAAKAERLGLMKDGHDSATVITENGDVLIGYGDKLNFDGLYSAKKGEVPTMTLDGKPVSLLFADDEINGTWDGVKSQWGAGSGGTDAVVTFGKLSAITLGAGVAMRGVALGVIPDALGKASTANRGFMAKVVGAPVDIARRAVNSSAVDKAVASRVGTLATKGADGMGMGLIRFGAGAAIVAGFAAIGNTIYGGYKGFSETNKASMDALNQVSQAQ